MMTLQVRLSCGKPELHLLEILPLIAPVNQFIT